MPAVRMNLTVGRQLNNNKEGLLGWHQHGFNCIKNAKYLIVMNKDQRPWHCMNDPSTEIVV